MELKKKPSSTFSRKVDFLEGAKVEILDYTERPNNFDPKKTDNVLVLKLNSKEVTALEINNSNVNQLIDWFGTETEKWVGEKVTITAVDEGVQLIEGIERQCYSLQFEK